jgi:hypothetical protein
MNYDGRWTFGSVDIEKSRKTLACFCKNCNFGISGTITVFLEPRNQGIELLDKAFKKLYLNGKKYGTFDEKLELEITSVRTENDGDVLYLKS